MENLLDVLARGLKVRITTNASPWRNPQSVFKFEYREVPKEVSEQFKNELRKHVYAKTKKIESGTRVDYCFDYWDDDKARRLRKFLEEKGYNDPIKRGSYIPPQKPFRLGANNNLAEVFCKLPPLGINEEYGFSCETYIRLSLTEGHDDVKMSVSPWIKVACSKLQIQ